MMESTWLRMRAVNRTMITAAESKAAVVLATTIPLAGCGNGMMMSLTTLFRRGRAANTAPIETYEGPVKRVRPSRNVYATIELPDGMGVDDLTANKAGANMLQKIE